jgi:hypothetical protein
VSIAPEGSFASSATLAGRFAGDSQTVGYWFGGSFADLTTTRANDIYHWSGPSLGEVVYPPPPFDENTGLFIGGPAQAAPGVNATGSVYVVETTAALSLADPVDDFSPDIYAIDRDNGAPILLTPEAGYYGNAAPVVGGGGALDAVFAFISDEPLEVGDDNGAPDLYVCTGVFSGARDCRRRVVDALPVANAVGGPSISQDGRYVAFVTFAALLPADQDGLEDVYRVDLLSDALTLVSGDTAADENCFGSFPHVLDGGDIVMICEFGTGAVDAYHANVP